MSTPDTPPSPDDAPAALPDGPRAPAARPRLLRPVALVGLMGAGKTTVGRRLAAMLDAPFVDSDEEIEAAARMSVAEIFASMGEDAFRQGERRVIARLVRQPRPAVIATGGGAFMNDDTRALLLSRAATVWIRAELDTLVERVGRKNTRPLLAGGDPRRILAELMARRHPVYAEAAVVVDSRRGEKHEAVAARILDGLRALGDVIEEGPDAPQSQETPA
ncbi:shikimate kinase [Oceanicella actignis]|uniref:shikimate kinase n=1 Tax=Oceanicella actignis TaxID=1189325 RepID=UPI0012520BE2|nr:shikimate kinase [Oceanicella actignis]TYO89997.1 shikimate kinase [Oceanicella actignis]